LAIYSGCIYRTRGILTYNFQGLIGDWSEEEQIKASLRREEGGDEWIELRR